MRTRPNVPFGTGGLQKPMNSETKVCQNCKQRFVIEPEDFAFYEKINVPPPTFCPQCRLQRRMAFINERTFYKRKCDLCQRDFISLYPADSEFTVYCASCFWDKWNPLDYGIDLDFSKPFFAQLKELFKKVPHTGQQQITPTMVDSDFCCICSYLKNCYLVVNSDYDEDCMYSTYLEQSKFCVDILHAGLSERCYDSVNLYKCNNVSFSQNCVECINVSFSKNLIGCSDCFGCVNLRNKKHHIFNQPYSKEEYAKKISEYDLGSFSVIQTARAKTNSAILGYPRKYMEVLNSVNCTGDYIYNSKNTKESYEIVAGEDCKYCHFLTIAPTKDSYDFTMWGGGAERMYECMGAGGGQTDVRFAFECWSPSHHLNYCMELAGATHDMFGCYAAINKSYCILNKQYTKEEYEMLVPKIIQHMKDMPYVDSAGHTYRYGEFFPPELSSFRYNETLSQEYFPLDRETALHKGYIWRENTERKYEITISADELPDHIRDVSDEIVQAIVGCAHKGECDERCSTAFRITPAELAFYRHMNLALPRFCPNCRHYTRLKTKNSIQLWQRKCTCVGQKSENGTYTNTAIHFHGDNPCPNKFETSYAPERPEIVYCESCYNSEVV